VRGWQRVWQCGSTNVGPAVSKSLPKSKAENFDYQKSFSKLYRDLGRNGNEIGYRKYENEIGSFLRK